MDDSNPSCHGPQEFSAYACPRQLESTIFTPRQVCVPAVLGICVLKGEGGLAHFLPSKLFFECWTRWTLASREPQLLFECMIDGGSALQ